MIVDHVEPIHREVGPIRASGNHCNCGRDWPCEYRGNPDDSPCSCVGHKVPGVDHFRPCCRFPHIDHDVWMAENEGQMPLW